MKKHRIAQDVKEQILNRIKNEGITVAQASKEQHSLFYIFEKKLLYSRKEGYRTAQIPSAVRLFEEFATTNSHDVELAGIEPACKRCFYKNLHT